MVKYKIGQSVVSGKMVCKPSQLTEVTEKTFFKMLENSLRKNNFMKYMAFSQKKTNLKKGLTIGSDYFILECE